MPESGTVSANDQATAEQYNDLRKDVIDASLGHIHDGSFGKLIAQGSGIYGDGSDGIVTIAAPTTLTRDMYYSTLTVNDVLTTAGFRIFCTGTLTNNSTIHNNGEDATENGGVAAGGAGGSLGEGQDGENISNAGNSGAAGGVVFIAAKTIDNSGAIISANGGDGANALTGGGANAGVVGHNAATSLGGDGGDGGDSGAGGDKGAKGTATAPIANIGGFRTIPFAIILKEIETTVKKINGGAGGGTGARDGANNNGGGGGGGGGLVVLIYNTLTAGTETASAGTFGTGFGTGDDGTAGTAGTVIKIAN